MKPSKEKLVIGTLKRMMKKIINWITRHPKTVLLLLILGIIEIIVIYYFNITIRLEDVTENLVVTNEDAVSGIGDCPLMPPVVDYLQPVNLDTSEFSNLGMKYNLNEGGWWYPKHCISKHHVAVIISYRNRFEHLKTFLVNIHPFLQRQLISYQIFVVEQNLPEKFNRAKLFNVGYSEAIKLAQFRCLIFHDVDLIPENPNNIYACTKLPRHMTSSIDVFGYKNPYFTLFGGAVAILRHQFEAANGFSNQYFGWGGEDDDFYRRVTRVTRVCRFADYVSRYKMLSHEKAVKDAEIDNLLDTSSNRIAKDGINSLNYSLLSLDFMDAYTRVLVNL